MKDCIPDAKWKSANIKFRGVNSISASLYKMKNNKYTLKTGAKKRGGCGRKLKLKVDLAEQKLCCVRVSECCRHLVPLLASTRIHGSMFYRIVCSSSTRIRVLPDCLFIKHTDPCSTGLCVQLGGTWHHPHSTALYTLSTHYGTKLQSHTSDSDVDTLDKENRLTKQKGDNQTPFISR